MRVLGNMFEEKNGNARKMTKYLKIKSHFTTHSPRLDLFTGPTSLMLPVLSKVYLRQDLYLFQYHRILTENQGPNEL